MRKIIKVIYYIITIIFQKHVKILSSEECGEYSKKTARRSTSF